MEFLLDGYTVFHATLFAVFLCMLVFILFGWAIDFFSWIRKKKEPKVWIREYLDRKRKKRPNVPKPEIKPPAQRPTKIMGQNTARDFQANELNETFITSATKKESIINMLELINYKDNYTLQNDPEFQSRKPPPPPLPIGRKILE